MALTPSVIDPAARLAHRNGATGRRRLELTRTVLPGSRAKPRKQRISPSISPPLRGLPTGGAAHAREPAQHRPRRATTGLKSQVPPHLARYIPHMSIDSTTASPEWAYSLTAPFTFERIPNALPLTAGPGELLVRLAAGAVCGSDIPFARGAMTPPRGSGAPGHPLHEIVGTVVHSEYPDFVTGDRVVGWASDWCALRELFVTHGDRVAKVRMNASDAHVTVAQSVACLLTVFERLGSLAGRSVAIIGMGPFGLMTSVMAKESGACRIVGVDPIDRTSDVDGLPVDSLVRTTSRLWAATLNEEDRPDLIFEMVGHQSATLADAMNAVATGGTVVAYGVPDDDWYALPMREFFRHNGTLITGVTLHHRKMLELAQDYLICHPEFAEHIVTDLFPVTQVDAAFHAASSPRAGQRKIVLTVP